MRLKDFSIALLVLPVLVAAKHAQAQVQQPSDESSTVVVTPIAPVPPVTATMDVFAVCPPAAGSLSLLVPNAQNAVKGSADIALVLKTKLAAGSVVCAVETFSGRNKPASHNFPAVTVKAAPAVVVAIVGTVTLHPVTISNQTAQIDPVPPPANDTASLDIYAACPATGGTPAGPSLLQAGQQTSVDSSGKTINLQLAAAPAVNATFCAVESFAGPVTVSPANLSSKAVTATAAPPAPDPAAQARASLEAEDVQIRLLETDCHGDQGCLKNLKRYYDQFKLDADKAAAATPPITASDGQNWQADYRRLLIRGAFENDLLVGKVDFSAENPVGTLQNPTGDVSHARLLGGIDVSASSSADPAAKFLLDLALDLPLTNGASAIEAHNWLWGYVRLSSIQQPGAPSGISTPTTYVQSLTSAAPNQIVQSFEANGGYELRLVTFPEPLRSANPVMFSLIASGGIITPISGAQNSPVVYIDPPQLQTYYAQLAASTPTPVNVINAANVAAACSAATPPATTPPTCYIAQFQQERTSLFRDYGAGIRFKRYYYNKENKAYIFPANFDFTVGQNEYVTGGALRHFVAHFGGSTPIGLLPGVTVYTYVDLTLQKNQAPTGDQQFPLAMAASSITPASPNVAAVYVTQPERDRYRFGIAYDLASLKAIFSAKSK